jgi:hypothetical protein
MSDATDRLARTRLAIIEQLYRREPVGAEELGYEAPMPPSSAERPWAGQGGWLRIFRRATRTWWRNHPAKAGLDLVKPALSNYAARKPIQFLAIAAGAGAVFVVARLWRLIPVTGLAMALIKSSSLSSVVLAALSAADSEPQDPPSSV